MTTLVKGPVPGDLVKMELDPNYNREVVTLLAGQKYGIGSVLGQVTASGKYTLSPAASTAGIEGAETVEALLIDEIDATDGDVAAAVIKRGPCNINPDFLVYHASVDTAGEITAKKAALTALGIISRTPA